MEPIDHNTEVLEDKEVVEGLLDQEYTAGFYTDIEAHTFAKGLNEEVIRKISKTKNEPEFLLEFRLKAFKLWQKMEEPEWARVNYPPIDFNAISYYSAPVQKKKKRKL